MINKLFNNKQLDLLKEAEEYFRQVKNGFKRNSPHTLDVKVYETLNSIEPTQEPKYSCSKCVFNLYKRASEIYFISKEIKNDGKEKNNQKNSTTTTSSTTTSKQRRGRKPNGIKRSKP